jgi:hypothetical protein
MRAPDAIVVTTIDRRYATEAATSTAVFRSTTPRSMPIWVSSGPAWSESVSTTTSRPASTMPHRWGARKRRRVNGRRSSTTCENETFGSG